MHDGVTIRRATNDDATALMPMLDALAVPGEHDERVDRYRERLGSLTDNPMHHIVVAERDGTLLGYAAAQDYGPALRQDWSVARIHDLWVAPAVRGAGVGRALFTAIREWAQRETNIRVLEWQSSDVAVGFYRHLGLESDDGADGQQYRIEVRLPGEAR